LRFRLNRYQRQWRQWREGLRQDANDVFVQQKMCPACRALVDRKTRQCPFCGEKLRVIGTGPLARLFSRVMPADVSYSACVLLVTLVMYAIEAILSGNNWFSPNLGLTRLGVSLPLPYMRYTGEYWRWVTAIFLHAGLLHIGFNMFALFDLGPLVESLYGPAKFITAYFVTGACGFALSSAAGHLSLGASGALFGLLGMMASYAMHRRDAAAQQMRSQIFRWIFYALIWSLLPGIDMFAHVGGLISGFVFGRLAGDDPPFSETAIRFWQVIQTLVILVAVGCFVLMARSHTRIG
jgi:rhomboid protease GluP